MISGAGRSGTTALMRCMAAAGMKCDAKELLNANAEGNLTEAFASDNASYIAARAAVFGHNHVAKVPMACVKAAINPGLMDAWSGNWLIVMRDPVATASREISVRSIARGAPHYMLAVRGAESQQIINSAIQLSRFTGVAMVSYEKLLSGAATVMQDIASWLSIEIDINAAVSEVVANDPRYINSD
jgi:hypothetical protein